ncbi:BON domain-containing protein [Agrobacterium tumefaciens]|uniref:BON domain-containing protein n=1 Tax=Agrobacterium tumefaciens TaxID=358 RepID=UPI0027D7BF19|nr:BON domain-containing protein [Agrobacterium tumefaciens]
MNDNTLRQNIIDELEFEPSIDAANIGVAVDAGVATLTGHVPTYMQKASVESIVLRVKGVKGLAEEIEVRPFSANLTADDEIAKRAVSTIKWNTVVPDDAVNVQVEKGWITLRGAVEWRYQREAAADAIRPLSGVRGVTNWIEVKPKVSVADVKKRIEDALKRNAEVEAQKIKINVADGQVILEGQVDAWSERQAAERAAWAAPGVRSVVDHLRIF